MSLIDSASRLLHLFHFLGSYAFFLLGIFCLIDSFNRTCSLTVSVFDGRQFCCLAHSLFRSISSLLFHLGLCPTSNYACYHNPHDIMNMAVFLVKFEDLHDSFYSISILPLHCPPGKSSFNRRDYP